MTAYVQGFHAITMKAGEASLDERAAIVGPYGTLRRQQKLVLHSLVLKRDQHEQMTASQHQKTSLECKILLHMFSDAHAVRYRAGA